MAAGEVGGPQQVGDGTWDATISGNYAGLVSYDGGVFEFMWAWEQDRDLLLANFTQISVTDHGNNCPKAWGVPVLPGEYFGWRIRLDEPYGIVVGVRRYPLGRGVDVPSCIVTDEARLGQGDTLATGVWAVRSVQVSPRRIGPVIAYVAAGKAEDGGQRIWWVVEESQSPLVGSGRMLNLLTPSDLTDVPPSAWGELGVLAGTYRRWDGGSRRTAVTDTVSYEPKD